MIAGSTPATTVPPAPPILLPHLSSTEKTSSYSTTVCTSHTNASKDNQTPESKVAISMDDSSPSQYLWTKIVLFLILLVTYIKHIQPVQVLHLHEVREQLLDQHQY